MHNIVKPMTSPERDAISSGADMDGGTSGAILHCPADIAPPTSAVGMTRRSDAIDARRRERTLAAWRNPTGVEPLALGHNTSVGRH